MFTGIVEELGELVAIDPTPTGAQVRVRAPLVTSDATLGGSVAVDGTCLTITDLDDTVFTADVVPETLARTTLGRRHPGDRVNLERAMSANGRLDGHIVAGHVDGPGTILERTIGPDGHVLRIGLAHDLAGLVAPKGSIAVDGVSLTVVDVERGAAPSFTVAVIPTTLARTTLGTRDVGDPVNLEVDVLARYVAAALADGLRDALADGLRDGLR